MEDLMSYDEAVAKAKREARETNQHWVVMPFEEDVYYYVMSHERWAWSSDGDYVALFNPEGEEVL